MRRVWIIARREYLQRVRTRAFLFSTVFVPLFMAAVFIVPGRLMMSAGETQQLAVVASRPEVAEAVKKQLTEPRADAAERRSSLGRQPQQTRYEVEIILDPSDERRRQLLEEIRAKRLDGFLWLSDEDLEKGTVIFASRRSSDFIGAAQINRSITQAVTKTRIAEHGIPAEQVEELFRPVKLQIQDAADAQTRTAGAFVGALVMMLLLYMSVLIYGIGVMRSVLEEKTSRIMEVLLASATPKQLMAGKLLGVGSVGLTQLFIWAAAALILAMPGLAASSEMLRQANLSLATVLYFWLFYIGGFLLYSAVYAALGAMVNSEEEAQSMQFFAMTPLILSMVFMWYVIRNPEAPLSVFLSLFPFTSPLLMYLRIGVQTPPAWQIALCFALLIAGIYAVIWTCARIYRVGILMYGKKPTLPELLRWIRYA